MRALVTGVSGFVGGYLAEYLLSLNIEVWGTAHKSLVYLEESPDFMKRICIRTIDISNKHQVKKVLMECKPDFIFHLASQSSVATSWENPQLTIDINVNGTINLLESIKELKQNARILLVGSCEEYGFVEPDSVPINENQELKPTTPYAVSKATQSMLGTLYNKSYGIDIVVVRAFNQIGIRQDARFVVPSLAKKIARIEKKGKCGTLRVGNLDIVRDFLDVRDAVSAYWGIIEKGNVGEVYNIGSGRGYRIGEVLDILLSFSDCEFNIEIDESKIRPVDIPISICDNTKIKSCTGWKPTFSIEYTLRDILNYWRKRQEEV